MKKELLIKTLALSIVVLFIFTAVTPSIGVSSYLDDTTPPVTIIEVYGLLGENGWYVDYLGLDIKLVATDDISGVNKTFYKIDGKEWLEYTKMFEINENGIHTVDYYSVDNAGNVEDVKFAEIKLDWNSPDVYVDINRLGIKKWKFITFCSEETSGMDRVEFYCDDKLEFIDYEKSYEWIWNGSKLENHKFNVIAYDKAGNAGIPYSWPVKIIVGIISNRKITENYISFFAIKAWILSEGTIISFKNFTISTFGFSGYIGKFFIFANYITEWEGPTE